MRMTYWKRLVSHFLILILCNITVIYKADASPALPSSSGSIDMSRIARSVKMNDANAVTAKGFFESVRLTLMEGLTIRIPGLIPFISSLLIFGNSSTNSDKLEFIHSNGNNGSSSSSTDVTNDTENKTKAVASNNKSTSSFSSISQKTVNAQNSDWCGENILMDLTLNKELTYKSTQFPEPQSSPYACSWNVKTSRNCRRGKVTLTVDSRSRLPDESRCSQGYLRVSPFMKEAKLCGEVGTMPHFQWFVDNTQHPPVDADVSIIMKNIGLNDGNNEGVAFTLTGECFSSVMSLEPKLEVSNTKMDNVESISHWLNALQASSAFHPISGGDNPDEKQSPGGRIRLYSAGMALKPVSKLPAKASDKINNLISNDRIISLEIDVADSSVNATETINNKKPTRKFTFYSPLFFILRRMGVL